jgi:L-serine dehydratase
MALARGRSKPLYPHVGVFDLFRIGIGPSSSHTVGPMRAALDFVTAVVEPRLPVADPVIRCDLYGSLASTGSGHGTDTALVLGLSGERPETVDPDAVAAIVDEVRRDGAVSVGPARLRFRIADDIVFHRGVFLAGHPNAMRLALLDGETTLAERTYHSIGGGFIVVEGEPPAPGPTCADVPHPFGSAAELLALAVTTGLSIAAIARSNEEALRPAAEVDDGLDRIWAAMRACVERGLAGRGMLPGGLSVRRRAADLLAGLQAREQRDQGDPLRAMEWVDLFALAVNEENAAGGRVVTAPTNGAAGIVPAVLSYYERFVGTADRSGIHDFLLTAGAIGAIIKKNASISGADVGCQGEVGSASAMAAAGLAAALGGSSGQIENAAEIALEHNLGLTCDPVGGLVQIPCIERNAVAAVKAINAARLALCGDGSHRVSLDQAVETMRQTGRDMKRKYKETATGGLAVNVPVC